MTTMRRARFSVLARLDDASRVQAGTVTVTVSDRGDDTFAVRPKRRRREYTLPLSFVAAMVTKHVIKVELAAKRAERKAKRGKK